MRFICTDALILALLVPAGVVYANSNIQASHPSKLQNSSADLKHVACKYSVSLPLFKKDILKLRSKTRSSSSIFTDQANIITSKLFCALEGYKGGHGESAHDIVEDAYWNTYDNILEIKYRSFVSPAKIFSVENEFHTLSHQMSLASKNTGRSGVNVRDYDKARVMTLALVREVNNESTLLTKEYA